MRSSPSPVPSDSAVRCSNESKMSSACCKVLR